LTWRADTTKLAIEQARQKAASRHLAVRFLVADALQLGRLGRTFECVLDVGLFHTFDDGRLMPVRNASRCSPTSAIRRNLSGGPPLRLRPRLDAARSPARTQAGTAATGLRPGGGEISFC